MNFWYTDFMFVVIDLKLSIILENIFSIFVYTRIKEVL